MARNVLLVIAGVVFVSWLAIGQGRQAEPQIDRPGVASLVRVQAKASAPKTKAKPTAKAGSTAVDFNRDIRPILSDKCFSCHGPDGHDRKAQLRLDTPKDGDKYAGAYFVIEPGDPASSDLVKHIHASDKRKLMPPADSGLKLTAKEKALLEQWIKEGATYQDHWSYVPAKDWPVPQVKTKGWAKNTIDKFVLARLEAEGLKPAPQATKAKLLRRLTQDLTGLPPTLAELDAFLADKSEGAYEKAVDRLLASPRFGERMALPWLDAARYADTNGYSIDDHRDMWLWREWVIDAYNRNMPYDKFLVHQLAGDLMPSATDTTRLATGFLRNSMNTHEGGTIPAEYRTIYIADKIDTVSTVFMGMTMRCAQCHDHKYDPLSQKEYYQMYAFFDSADIRGMGAANANTAPVIRTDGVITKPKTWVKQMQARIATLKRYLLHPPELVKPRAAWEPGARKTAQGELAKALDTPAVKRSDAQWETINSAFAKTTRLWGRHTSTIKREIIVLERELKQKKPSVMVMKEKGPRQTYVLTRGEYDKPDKKKPVDPGVPAVLPTLVPKTTQTTDKATDKASDNATDKSTAQAKPTRLDLANWLIDPKHPLTARVAVNRTWQMLFGRGLVSTPNDFGAQGSYPTHPRLLDHLALSYINSKWDTKKLVKQMVMSATYRQSSNASKALLERDPNNELLARMSRVRLPAEFIRDGALAIAGKLDDRVGGPSVYPRQPHGLWREVSHFGYGNAFTAQAFYPSRGDDLTRRSMYTFWKRTSPPPSLAAFDAPTREVCTVQRSRTNTPLQALVLLNDPEYFNASKALAALAVKNGGKTTSQRIAYMFRRATARMPSAGELKVLGGHLTQALAHYRTGKAAKDAANEFGSTENAAWSSLASVILNLDETITRE